MRVAIFFVVVCMAILAAAMVMAVVVVCMCILGSWAGCRRGLTVRTVFFVLMIVLSGR